MAKVNWFLITGLILRLVILVVSNSHPDVGNHLDWGNRFWLYSPSNFYTEPIWSVSAPNQPFNTIYLFAIIALIKNGLFSFILFLNNQFSFFPSVLVWIFEINLHVWLVKLPSIISDIVLSWLIYKIVKKYQPTKAILASCLFLFNPVVIYNSTVWGQTDSLINLFAILGLWLTFNKKYYTGTFLFFLSFTFKMSLLIYLPIYLILLIKQLPPLKTFLFSHLIVISIFFIETLPFSAGKNIINWPINLYLNQVLGSQGNMLNGNAYNLWFLPYGADIVRQSTKIQILTGTGLFLLVFIPIIYTFARKKLSALSLFFSCLLVAFASFLLLTNMHERYLYPIFPILPVIYSLQSKVVSWFKIINLSITHLLNLYQLWYFPMFLQLKVFIESNSFLFGKALTIYLFLTFAQFLLNYIQSDTQN